MLSDADLEIALPAPAEKTAPIPVPNENLSKRSRSWCFTLNNPKADITADVYERIGARYIVVGDEKGAEGTPHHQGYITFPNAVRFATAKDKLPDGCHIEAAKGSASQNRTYCTKQSTLIEFGDVPRRGRRTDLEEVREQVDAGCTMCEICDTARSFQAIRGAEVLLKYKEPQRNPDDPLDIYWFWGPSGSGKTLTAYRTAPDAWWSNAKGLQWWDGYDRHDDIILDDFRPEHCMFDEMLRVCQGYPLRVPVKGGFRQLLAKRIFITCPWPPGVCFRAVSGHENLYQITRRIKEIREFSAPDTDTYVGG